MANPCLPPPGPRVRYICVDEFGNVVGEDPYAAPGDEAGTPLVQGPLRYCGTEDILCEGDQVSGCISDTDGAPTSYGPAPEAPDPEAVAGPSPLMSRVRLNRDGLTPLPYSTQKHPDQLIDLVLGEGEGATQVPFDPSTGRFSIPQMQEPLVRCVDSEPLTGAVPNCLLFEDGVTPVPVDENNHPLIPAPITECSYIIDEVKDAEIEDPLLAIGATLTAGTANTLIEKTVSWTNDLGCPVGVTLKVEIGASLGPISSTMPPGQTTVSWSVDGAPYSDYAQLGWSAVAGDLDVGTLFFSRETELGELAPSATKSVQLKFAVNPGFNTPEVVNGAISFALVVRRLVIQ